MRDQDVKENQAKENRQESGDKREAKKHDDKRRATDTLTDENPLIFRGMD